VSCGPTKPNPVSKLIVLKAVVATVPLRLIGLSFPTRWFSFVTDDTRLSQEESSYLQPGSDGT